MVSYCRTHSQREDYVEELRNHIHVDVYGACGDLSCSSNDCMAQVERSHKFYLAFENSVCKDYVTEKFWNALNSTMVPVVLGNVGHSMASKF